MTQPETERSFADVVGEWQRHLLQLDRRNNLLYFREGRSAVCIKDHIPASLFDRLLKAPTGLSFDYSEPRKSRSRAPFEGTAPNAEDEPEPFVVLGDLKADCPPIELQRRLRNLHRRAKEWKDEQGLNVLFLALGSLKWVDDGDQEAVAPVLLVPCKLDRPSPRDPFTLELEEDVPLPNSTLGRKLEDFGIKLPDSEGELEVAQYLADVRRIVAHRPDWSVREDSFLGIFAYSKLAMWRDLDTVRVANTKHPIVLAMAGKSSAEAEPAGPSAFPDQIPGDLSGAALDDVLDVRDQFAVLPADYSQLLAITSANSGANLVVHGPPGTGKSQTIANMIASAMAHGKSVLFVSEKTAALDVVKRRLEDKGLGVFCLDLHGERGNKSNVYKQLQNSVDDLRASTQTDFDYAALAERRRKLNSVVRALHQVRQPFGRTIFQVQGRFASLQEAPHVPLQIEDIGNLDQARMASIVSTCDRVGLRRREFEEHKTSRWRVLRSGRPSLELTNKIRADMTKLASSVETVLAAGSLASQKVGLQTPIGLGDVDRVRAVARHLTNAGGILKSWLEPGSALRANAKQQQGLDFDRLSRSRVLAKAFGTVPDWDYPELGRRFVLTKEERQAIARVVDGSWSRRLVIQVGPDSQSIRRLADVADRVNDLSSELGVILATLLDGALRTARELQLLAARIARVAPVPGRWLEPRGREEVAATVSSLRTLSEEIDKAEARLFSEFEPIVMDRVDEELVVRFRTIHQSFWKRLFDSSYRRDRNVLRSARLNKGKFPFSSEIDAVECIAHLRRCRIQWAGREQEAVEILGPRFQGRKTSWDSVARDLQEIDLLVASAGNPATKRLLTGNEDVLRVRQLADDLNTMVDDLVSAADQGLSSDLIRRVRDGTIDLRTMASDARKATAAIERFEGVVSDTLGKISAHKVESVEELRDLLIAGAELRDVENRQLAGGTSLGEDFGEHFRGFNTDWLRILERLDWIDELKRILPDGMPQELADQAVTPMDAQEYRSTAERLAGVLDQVRSTVSDLGSDYDFHSDRRFDVDRAELREIRELCGELIDDADAASDWLSYRTAVAGLEGSVGSAAVDAIRGLTPDSSMVRPIVERSVLASWLDWVYDQEPALVGFTSLEQDQLIVDFKELDERLAAAAALEVRRRAFSKYPNLQTAAVRASELGVLRGELSKRRRQWPVRKLFGNVPRLIQALKPCFFVSPLAVSQYLPFSQDQANTLMFDLVIFDEASQVFPEDAIPAILRGKQTILAGDRKQLPPSNFWRNSTEESSLEDDDDSDETTRNQLEGRESVLDAGVGLVGSGFNEVHLNVHYRSRHESLIRFSNHHFYDDRLLTFPSPGIDDDWLGIHDHHVPDGRYDAGATRTNRAEAEAVVDQVFEHMRTRPIGESLGVVALSRAQADLIETLIDERRILERDVDERFKDRPDEPFFVKNLESVQGDERDRMIISIGYGPTTASGAVPNRFGPLNNEGGERRLNVAVTRARLRVDLFHSLRPQDITSQQPGPRLLRRYIEYAANPVQAFETQAVVHGAADDDNPFEDAVERAIVARGYRVARQVGVAGYKIDLAIQSEDGSKYDLGIECDGRTYHSAPAARDRDSLRQKVLEGLGWRLHRIWSTAWIRNHQLELSRLESALTAARAGSPSPAVSDPPRPQVEPAKQVPAQGPQPEQSARPHLEIPLVGYEKAPLPPVRPWSELKYETTGALVEMLKKIAEVEGPVHVDVLVERIREHYSLGRIRGSARDNVSNAIDVARSAGAIKMGGMFVWLTDEQLQRVPRTPVDGDIEHVPPTEIKNLAVAVVSQQFGLPRPALVIEVARQLGFARTGERIAQAIDRAIGELISEGKLSESFGSVHVAAVG